MSRNQLLLEAVKDIADDLLEEALKAGDHKAVALIENQKWDAIVKTFPEAVYAQVLQTVSNLDVSVSGGEVWVKVRGKNYKATEEMMSTYLDYASGRAELETEATTYADTISETGEAENLIPYARRFKDLADASPFVTEARATPVRNRDYVLERIVWDPEIIFTFHPSKDVMRELRKMHESISIRAYESF